MVKFGINKFALISLAIISSFLIIIFIYFIIKFVGNNTPKLYDSNNNPKLIETDTNNIKYYYPATFSNFPSKKPHILSVQSIDTRDNSVSAIVFDVYDSSDKNGNIKICSDSNNVLQALFAKELNRDMDAVEIVSNNPINSTNNIGCNIKLLIKSSKTLYTDIYYVKKKGSDKFYSYVITTDNIKCRDFLSALDAVKKMEIK